MSTPHRGARGAYVADRPHVMLTTSAGRADDPVLLDSSDDEANPPRSRSSQAGPSRPGMRTQPTSSSQRTRASLSHHSGVVDLTQNDAPRQSTSPRKSQHSNSNGRHKRSTISPRDLSKAIDLSDDQPSAPPGSWGNPTPMELPLPPSQTRRLKEKEPTPPPGSWGNPVPVVLPSLPSSPRSDTAPRTSNVSKEPLGSWGNPQPIILPSFPTVQTRLISPKAPIGSTPLFLPAESPTTQEGGWSDPAPIPVDPVLLELEMDLPPTPSRQANNSAGPSVQHIGSSPPPALLGSTPPVVSNVTKDPPRGSWGNPEPIDFPLPSHLPQPGTWGNPEPIQLPPMLNSKRAFSPTSPLRDDTHSGSRSRTGKARKLNTPEAQNHQVDITADGSEVEIKPPSKKLGPRWVTADPSDSSASTSAIPHPVAPAIASSLPSASPPFATDKPQSPKETPGTTFAVRSKVAERRRNETKVPSPEPVLQVPPGIIPTLPTSSNSGNALALSDVDIVPTQPLVEEGTAASSVQRTPPPQVNVDEANQDQPMDVDPDTSVDISPLIPTHNEYDTGEIPSSLSPVPTLVAPSALPAVPTIAPATIGVITGPHDSDPPATDAIQQEVPNETADAVPAAEVEPETHDLSHSEKTLSTVSKPETAAIPETPSVPATATAVSDFPESEGIVPLEASVAPAAAFVPEPTSVPEIEPTSEPPIESTGGSPTATAVPLTTANPEDTVDKSADNPPTALGTNSVDVVSAVPGPSKSEEEPVTDLFLTSEPPPPAISATDSALGISLAPASEPGIESSTISATASAALPVRAEVDVKPSMSEMSAFGFIPGNSSLKPIEIDDEDLDFFNSHDEEDVAINDEVEGAVENVRIGVDGVEIRPAHTEVVVDAHREVRDTSVGSTPSIQEIKPEEVRQQPEAGPSRRSTRISERSPEDEPVHDGPSTRVQALDTIRARRGLKRHTPSGTTITPVVEIPTRSKRTWEGVIESEGESDVEEMLDLYLDSSPSSGPSHAPDMVEHNGFTLRSTFSIPWNSSGTIQSDDSDDVMISPVHSILSITIPDTPVPPGREGQANRTLNTRLIDEWNRRKPTLTNNPPLHRAVFEAYMAQSTSIDEPQADEIRVVNDVDTEGAPPDFEFQYSNDMLYNPDVPDPELGRGCDCEGPCDPTAGTCSCVKRQELYFYDLGMSGFAYDEHGHIKETSVAVWECGKNCGCPPSCMNRVIQRGRGKDTKIELFKTKWKGWGVRARANIPAGTFLGIYAGELITEQESEERGKLYAKLGRTYLFDCDGWQIAHPPSGLAEFDPRAADLAKLASRRAKITAAEANDPSYVYSAYSVDAFHYGFTRYFNHSCDPNLAITQAYVKDFHPERPILVIFARRPVKMNEELCISYKGLPDDDEIPEPMPLRKPLGKGGKHRKNKTSASAHITGVTKSKVAAKDRCMCKTPRCDGRMFNYGV
ncbi:hypothetical protein IAT40_000762 [Kwoniella sp. CBS 6097]